MASLPPDASLDRLVQAISPDGRLLRAWPLTGGISAAMTALEVAAPDSLTRKLVLRRPGPAALARNPRAAECEYRLLQILQGRRLAVPGPVYLDRAGEIFSAPSLVVEFVEGQPEFAPSDSACLVSQMAAALAQIHSLKASDWDFYFLPPLDGELAGSFDGPPTPEDRAFETERIRRAVRAAWPFPQRNAPALLHGDYWPGNLLWRGGQLAAVVDWEDAALGDPLADLAVSRLDILWIYGADAMHSFTRHYLSLAPIDIAALPYWDLCAALRLARLAGPDLAAWAAFFLPHSRPDITEHTIRGHHRLFIRQAFDKLA